MEFTIAQIKDFTQSKQLLEEAETLYEHNAVVSMDIDEFSNPAFIFINATILENKRYHEVNMSVDKDDYLIKAHVCSCHDFELAAPCAHAAAVLLKIYYEQMKKHTELPVSNLQDETALQLMDLYEQQLIYSTLAMNLNCAVHLTPVLEIKDAGILALTLKVGSKKQYTIKDLSEFLADIKHNATKKYGKELEFLHHRNCFDPFSQTMIDFLEAHIQDTVFFLHTKHERSYVQARNLCLTRSALDEFFDLCKEEEVYLRISDKAIMNLPFRSSHPPLTLHCIQDDHDQYLFSVSDAPYEIFHGGRYSYLIYDRYLYRCDASYTRQCLPFLAFMAKRKQPLPITKAYMPTFYHNVILSIKDHIAVTGADLLAFAPLPLSCRLYLDMPDPQRLTAKLIYCYGENEYNAFSSKPVGTYRNFNEEITVRMTLMRYMTRIDTIEGLALIEASQDAMYAFFQNGLEELASDCEIYATDKVKNLKTKDSISISMGVRMESDLLEISFDTDDFPIEELQYVLQAYRLNKKYYRMKNGSFVTLEDSSLQELASVLDGMHVKDCDMVKGHIQVGKYRSLYLDHTLKQSSMLKIERDHSFKDLIRSIKNIQDSDFEVPENLKHVLRNYQKTGFRWLKTMSAFGFGGLLADDMGIGKTIQILALLEEEKLHHPDSISFITCPSSLLLNWKSEIERFSLHLSALVVSGSAEDRKASLAQYQQYDVVITSYDYVKRDVEWYQNISFRYHILDEAQYIKNHTTKNAWAVKQIHSQHRFALSGTPIENSLAELWSIFDFLMPGYLFSYSYFKDMYEIPIVRDYDPLLKEELRHMVEPFILRRVKKDVLKELPEKVEKTLYIDMDETSKKLYLANTAMMRKDLSEKLHQDGKITNKIYVLSMLTRLRQLCCDPRLIYENIEDAGAKLTACMELIENCILAQKKVLLFSQFTSLLSLIETELQQRQISYYLLKGSTPKQQRQQYVNAFNNDDVPVFLISLKAGGTGLNLTGAEVVIHFDPWWNVSAQNQATDRAYRIGQHNNVQVFKLIAKDTLEEKIMKLQLQKQGLSDAILQSNEGVISNMPIDEIMKLF